MKESLRQHIAEPDQLERLYRSDKYAFRQAFHDLYPELQASPLAAFWRERLAYEPEGIHWGGRKEWGIVLGLAVLAGIAAKLPLFLGINEEFFYPRNLGFILFGSLSAYFCWKNHLETRKVLLIAAAGLAGLLYLNLLPADPKSDTLILACLHLLFVLWWLFGFSHAAGWHRRGERWIAFLKFNGDLLVMGVPLAMAGGLLSALTIGLFALIGLPIEAFYSEYVLVFGLAALPLVSAYLIQANPQVVGKISQVVASLFSPLVLLLVAVYLGVIFYSGKNPYTDREFLLLFNALLVGVLALIFFSIAGLSSLRKNHWEIIVLTLLSLLSILVNIVALSAILFRLAEWGTTPNRIAVLGGNGLILLHLAGVAKALIGILRGRKDLDAVRKAMQSYLPVYLVWAVLVSLLFPILFGFA
jgi:hypothetical protein